MSKGKEKATSFDKGKENACLMVYIQHFKKNIYRVKQSQSYCLSEH